MFSDAAVRFKKYDKSVSREAEEKAYIAAGKVFGSNNPTIFDPIQAKILISVELGDAIIKYQRKVGLKETGKLDFNTLSSVSSKELTTMMFEAPDA